MLDNKLIIYASNVKSYGGATLLQAMVDASDENCHFIINPTLELQRYPKSYVRKSGSLFSMLHYEYKLKSILNETNVVLCMANRPLFWKQQAYVVTFLASVFSIEIPERVPLSFTRKIKSRLQIFFNVLLKRNTNMFLARSQEMVDKCSEMTKTHSEYFPFLPYAARIKRSLNPQRTLVENPIFFYPADGSPHKNHTRLFKAWKLLHNNGFSATLMVTISTNQAREFCEHYDKFNILPLGYLPEDKLNDHYQKSDALIFPSLLESFPLALIEARTFDLPILACEKRFIREHVDPEESFDPYCEFSICAAVTRFIAPQEKYITRPDTSDLILYLRETKNKVH